jgi:hypothetical protein
VFGIMQVLHGMAKKTIGTDLAELLIKGFRFSGAKIID